MTQHDPLVRVRHMRDYAREAVELLGSKSLDDLRGDRTLQLALVQCIEVIGEASSRVDPAIKSRHPTIEWREAAAMRHKLIHGYDTIRFEVVYDTVRDDLPLLIDQLNTVLD